VVLNKIRMRGINEAICELYFMCQIGFNPKETGLNAQLESREVKAASEECN
jgi:hypothetical protein